MLENVSTVAGVRPHIRSKGETSPEPACCTSRAGRRGGGRHVTTQDRTTEPEAVPGRRHRLRLTLILGALIALGPLTIDMYLPALPSITADLLTTSSTIQLTLTGTLVGLALGQLIVGPLSDAVGRRRPLLIGTAIHVLASALIIIAPNVAVLGGLRVLQGVGAAAGAVVAMAIVRDLFTGRAAATLLSRLILVMGAAPVLAPTIGGELLRLTDWRGVFAALALYGLALLPVTAWGLRETLPPQRRRPAGARNTLRTYRGLLRDRTFVGLVLVAGLAMAALFGYVSGSSFVFQEQFGLDQQEFGLTFGAGAVWLIAATQLNPVLLRRFEPRQILVAAVSAGTLAGIALFAIASTEPSGLAGLLVPLWAVLFAAGLALPNAPALALSRHGEAAGTAAALLGAVQFGVGAAISPMVGVLGNDAVAMGAVVACAMLLALVVLVVVVRPWQLEDLDEDRTAAAATAH
ncbi:multidrug effflux MFS transporter [Pseudonocardia sp. K10HN5]|uniref:Multidrug effflux MFS transporter n=1 Tax=Pseudonocardia acidicola TaxID=2724939 RepID=A0ABX1SF59_9PSEU|nr:multidrug effflux MFS transporter [Pseudonocardia acidicola]